MLKTCNAQCHRRASDTCVDTQPGTPLLIHPEAAGGFLSFKLGAVMFPYLYVSFIILRYQTCFNREKPTDLCAILWMPFQLPPKMQERATEFLSEDLTDWILRKVSGEHALFWIINVPLKTWHRDFKHYKTKLDSRQYPSFYGNYFIQVNLFCKWKPVY